MSARATKEVMHQKFNIKEPEWRAMIIESVNNLVALRAEYAQPIRNCPPIVISGIIVSRGDGYTIDGRMTVEESENFHRDMIQVFAKDTKIDFVTAALMKYAEECIGIVNEASKCNLPVVISFTLDNNGNLRSGQTVKVN